MLNTKVIKFLLCLLAFCLYYQLCEGAQKNFRYTEPEERLIINDMLEYPENPKPMYGPKIWRKIAEHISEIRKLDPESKSFPIDRKPKSLSTHFQQTMLQSKGKVPGILLEKLPVSRKRRQEFEDSNTTPEKDGSNKKARLHEHSFNSEEDKFIIAEVLNYPRRPVPVHGYDMWEILAKRLREESKLDPIRFPHDRSKFSLRKRFRRILKILGEGPERDNFIKNIRSKPSKEKENEESSEEDTEDFSSWIEELQQAPVSVDFSNMEGEQEQEEEEEVVEDEDDEDEDREREEWAAWIEELQTNPVSINPSLIGINDGIPSQS